MTLQELEIRLAELGAEIMEFGTRVMADDTEVRVSDENGHILNIKRVELDGNGHIYIDGGSNP